MRLVIEIFEGSDRVAEYTFTSSPIRVGRSPLNNLLLETPWISQQHGVLRFDETHATFCDLGSKNGTAIATGSTLLTLMPCANFEILRAPFSRPAVLVIGTTRLVVRCDVVSETATGASSGTGERSMSLETRLARAQAPVEEKTRSRRTPALPPARDPVDPAAAAAAAYMAGGTRHMSRGELEAEQLAAAVPLPRALQSGPASSGARPAASALPPTPLPFVPQAGSGGYAAGGTRIVEGDGRDEILAAAAAMIAGRSPPAAISPSPSGPQAAHLGLSEPGSLLDRVLRAATPAGEAPPQLDVRTEALVQTLASVIDAFGRGLVELKRAYRSLGDELGVRAVGGQSALHRSTTAQQLVEYLLKPGVDQQAHLEELVDLFADFMIHEVAMLNGVKSGLRALVKQLNPAEGYAEEAGGGGRRFGFFDKSLERYREYFDGKTEDGGESVVLGEEFARAYAEAMGAGRTKG